MYNRLYVYSLHLYALSCFGLFFSQYQIHGMWTMEVESLLCWLCPVPFSLKNFICDWKRCCERHTDNFFASTCQCNLFFTWFFTFFPVWIFCFCLFAYGEEAVWWRYLVFEWFLCGRLAVRLYQHLQFKRMKRLLTFSMSEVQNLNRSLWIKPETSTSASAYLKNVSFDLEVGILVITYAYCYNWQPCLQSDPL